MGDANEKNRARKLEQHDGNTKNSCDCRKCFQCIQTKKEKAKGKRTKGAKEMKLDVISKFATF